ncbi:MAG: nickel pincer cofactor biosynthesis protein LarB [bacterium]
MDEKNLRELLEGVSRGLVEVDQALETLKHLPFEDLGFAKVDHHRLLRNGAPEVVYCPGKTPEQVREIVSRLIQRAPNVLATRATEEVFQEIKKISPEAQYHGLAKLVVARPQAKEGIGLVAVLSAGTADLPVAEEASLTAEVMGSRVMRFYDVGVAGIHRLLAHRAALLCCNAVVVAAGMEGALPSVVGGLVNRPVIAVPTSVGYGAHMGGLAALLTMLNSCVPWVSVVNIDNGFGAGYQAHMINSLCVTGGASRT